MALEKRLIGIYGSPRPGGNTDMLLDCFLDGVSGTSTTVERVYLRDLDYSPCTECNGCKKTGHCVIDDMLNPLFEKLLEYERVVFAYPLFFLGPPAITKAFIDRGQFLWVRKYVLGINPVKPGAERFAYLLSIGGFEGTEKVFRCNKSILRAFLPVCGLTYRGDLLSGGIEHREDVKRNEELCKRAREDGRKFVL
jgi:multimeric flavodoxin WrbA